MVSQQVSSIISVSQLPCISLFISSSLYSYSLPVSQDRCCKNDSSHWTRQVGPPFCCISHGHRYKHALEPGSPPLAAWFLSSTSRAQVGHLLELGTYLVQDNLKRHVIKAFMVKGTWFWNIGSWIQIWRAICNNYHGNIDKDMVINLFLLEYTVSIF